MLGLLCDPYTSCRSFVYSSALQITTKALSSVLPRGIGRANKAAIRAMVLHMEGFRLSEGLRLMFLAFGLRNLGCKVVGTLQQQYTKDLQSLSPVVRYLSPHTSGSSHDATIMFRV